VARILHISCDFPDVFQPNKTQAIKRLVDGTPEHQHFVYSLNRVDGFSGTEIIPFAEGRFSVAYRAPPKGLFLRSRLESVARAILKHIGHCKINVDIVHAHKLTIDGIVGFQIAKQLSLPIVFSIQGDMDIKVMNARPDLSSVFSGHVAAARRLFPFAPWAVDQVSRKFPGAANKLSLLPVMPADDTLSAGAAIHLPRLVSIFHLDSWRRKNLSALAWSVKLLAQRMPDIRLDIYGGGSPASFLAAREAVAEAAAGKYVEFMGPVANSDIKGILKDYAAFVMPTLRESYGLVHAEALFAGLPILISEHMGIDGILPECSFIKRCNPHSDETVAAGMDELIQNEVKAKAALEMAQRNGVLEPIRRSAILQTYREGLRTALNANHGKLLDPASSTG
jgi:glycosyltransferase involved in cell wall biosynthesis